MSGVLGIVPRMLAVNGGAYVSGAQLFAYNAGTTTKRAIYTTSALSVQHTNPLEADANGKFAAFWIDPDDGPYKLLLALSSDTDPPSSPLWTEDNIPVPGASVSEGSFTGTLTGMSAATTGAVNYLITSNGGGVGKKCRLYLPSNIVGTSNATAMTMTGLPAACRPSNAVWVACPLHDNSISVIGAAHIAADASTITFYIDATLSDSGFTNSNDKGLSAGWQIEYAL